MKDLASRLARGMGVAGIVCSLACSGCEKTATDTSSADSAVISRPQVATAEVASTHERTSVKRQRTSPLPREVSLWETNSTPSAATKLQPPTQDTLAAPTLPATGSPSVAHDLLARLAQLDLSHGSVSADQAKEVNLLLQQVREQGAAAVPAIREFLQRNEDVIFDALPGGESVDYSSLRLGLIDALHQIGGPEAVVASVEAIQATTDPLEIALLTLTLEQQSPGQYRELELTAAGNALNQALSGNWKGGDVSPLFETIQAVGDTNIVPILKQAVTRWNYYATLALAGLPDGAGIPTLIQLAQDPAISSLGAGDFALRPLAQVAVQYPDAANALIEDARQNRIPDSAWPTVVASLAGTYIQYGNQVFGSTAPALTWSAAEIDQRIALINQMLAVTSSPVAHQSLESALASLASRAPK